MNIPHTGQFKNEAGTVKYLMDVLEAIKTAVNNIKIDADSVNLNTDGIETLLTSIDKSNGADPISIVRPNNSTTYTAGDVIGNSTTANIEITNCGKAGSWVYITDIILKIVVSSVPLGMTSFTVRLYNANPSSLVDNDVYTLNVADKSKYIDKIDLSTVVDEGGILISKANNINKKVKLANGSTSLWINLVTNSGYTPSSQAEKIIETSTLGV